VHHDNSDRRPHLNGAASSPLNPATEPHDVEFRSSPCAERSLATTPIEVGDLIRSLSLTDISLGIVDEYPFTRECISSCLKLHSNNFKVLTFSNIKDCLLDRANDFDLILFHMHGSSAGRPDETIASLKPTFRSVPVIILSDLDANEWMLEALENGARGYIPTSTVNVAVTLEVIRLVRAGGTFVPPSSLQMIHHSPSPPEFRLDEPLTIRQRSVLHYLAQGRSNKIIAYELGMSESTVKVHVRNIMKKMQATNRTEAAFRAHSLWSGERQRLAAPTLAVGSSQRAPE
jgi:DNA-binding NarL/FixJ family response regulator